MDKQKTILVIEHDLPYGEMLKDALEYYGYQVILTYSATGGLDIVRQKHVDLILSDINMPSFNGVQLAKELTAMFLDIPVVLIAGVGDQEIYRAALKSGITDFLFKPFQIHDLPIVIDKNLERQDQEARRLKENKADILLKALRALMRALDAKDPYTRGHSQRVVKLAMLMAEELDLNSDERYTLQLSAFLHDIGKIGMPDDILKKADSLDGDEANIARDHPVVGSQIIGEIEEFAEVASVVRHHHERFDGQGYPDNLKGEAIPFFARILAIIDCYEALVSDRVYRKGVGQKKALQILQQNAGSQFDPKLVMVFEKVMERGVDDNQSGDIDQSMLLNIGAAAKTS